MRESRISAVPDIVRMCGVSGQGQRGDSGYFPMPEALRQLISAEMIRHFESFHSASADLTLSVRISALIGAHLRRMDPPKVRLRQQPHSNFGGREIAEQPAAR